MIVYILLVVSTNSGWFSNTVSIEAVAFSNAESCLAAAASQQKLKPDAKINCAKAEVYK